MIKVLIAEDSPSVAAMMREVLRSDPEINIVGWARSGREAIAMRHDLDPDVIRMDLNMPQMGGLEAIKTLSATRPIPILVVSTLIESRDSEIAFEALRYGALDVMGKPSSAGAGGVSRVQEELKFRIKAVSRIRPMHRFSKAEPPAPTTKHNAQ